MKCLGHVVFCTGLTVTVGLLGVGRSAGGTWYDNDWDYRQEITVSSSVTASSLTDFPVLVKITDTNPIFGKARSDGYDVLFTDANGNKLDHEIELYSDGGAKELDAWVRTNVSSAADTKLYMYYGNAGASDQQNVTGT